MSTQFSWNSPEQAMRTMLTGQRYFMQFDVNPYWLNRFWGSRPIPFVKEPSKALQLILGHKKLPKDILILIQETINKDKLFQEYFGTIKPNFMCSQLAIEIGLEQPEQNMVPTPKKKNKKTKKTKKKRRRNRKRNRKNGNNHRSGR